VSLQCPEFIPTGTIRAEGPTEGRAFSPDTLSRNEFRPTGGMVCQSIDACFGARPQSVGVAVSPTAVSTSFRCNVCRRSSVANVGEPVYEDFRRASGRLDRPTSELIREAMHQYRREHLRPCGDLRGFRPRSLGRGRGRRFSSRRRSTPPGAACGCRDRQHRPVGSLTMPLFVATILFL